MTTKTIYEDVDLTYDALVKKGREVYHAGLAYAYLVFNTPRESKSLRTFLIQREGELLWLPNTECTPDELKDWEYMCVGLSHITSNYGHQNKGVREWSVTQAITAGHFAVASYEVHGQNRSNGEDFYRSAAKLWNIPRYLPITSCAALFYLLYARHLRGDPEATLELQFLVDSLAPDIANYIDAVIGGEARHMVSKEFAYTTGNAPAEIEKEARDSGMVEFPYGKSPYIKENGVNITEHLHVLDRPVAWMEWKGIRERLGMTALNWCICVHLTTMQGSVGGPLWANCAILLRRREIKEISDIFFIDQAFSLQHNNGAVFNKLWDVNNLQAVLNAAFAGNMTRLPQYLQGETHKEIYRRVCMSANTLELDGHSGLLDNRTKVVDLSTKSKVLGIEAKAALELVTGKKVDAIYDPQFFETPLTEWES